MTLKAYARKPSVAPSPRKREKPSFPFRRRKHEKSPKSELRMIVKSYCMETPHTRKTTPQEGCPTKGNAFRKHVDVQNRSIASIFLLLSPHEHIKIPSVHQHVRFFCISKNIISVRCDSCLLSSFFGMKFNRFVHYVGKTSFDLLQYVLHFPRKSENIILYNDRPMIFFDFYRFS